MQRVEQAIATATAKRSYNALITETFELARNQARNALGKGLQPFPIVVKDCFAIEGAPMTCASRMLENFRPPYTATVVQRLIDKGACVIGKANLDEFCMGTSSALGYYGPVKSGLSEESRLDSDWLIPGGSSGGPAVAVQLGFAEMALGSDTGGSTRNPAAFNGLFGLKPTYGICSRFGLVPLVNSMDAPSIFAKSAEDCMKYLDIMAGSDERDATSIDLPSTSKRISSLKGLRVGIPKEYHNEKLSAEAWAVWNRAANVMEKQGAEIVQVSLPLTKYSLLCYHVLSAVDITSNMARFDGISFGYRSPSATASSSTNALISASRSESLNEVVRKRIFAGNYFLMKEHRDGFYERALRARRMIADECRKAIKEVDVLLTPVACGTAPLFSELASGRFSREDDDDFYTQTVNLAGVPAVSVPFGACSSSGLPIGVQLIADRLHDRRLLDIAALLYAAR